MTRFPDWSDYEEAGERLIIGTKWEVPPIDLHSDAHGRDLLVARWSDKRNFAKVPKGGLLKRFCNLKDASPQRIHRFARKFGLLYLCPEHGLPQWHPPQETNASACIARILDTTFEQYDDVADWRLWASRFASAAALTRTITAGGDTPSSVDVEAVFTGLGRKWEEIADLLRRPAWYDIPLRIAEFKDDEWVERAPPEWRRQSSEVQLFHLLRWLNWLLAMSQIRRAIVQLSFGPQRRPGSPFSLAVVDGCSQGTPLFGAIVNELAAQCADVQTLGRCQNTSCGKAFKPSRITDQYCARCRRSPRIQWRLAQTRRRARLRSEGKTARGTPRKRKKGP